MSALWIATEESWDFFLKHLDPGDPPCIGLDTEFIRHTTYWPTLCLLQIADAHRIWLIDPLSLAIDRRLWDMLQNPALTKIVHGGLQDLCALYGWAFARGYTAEHAFEGLSSFFDTQYAAWAFRLGRDLSYKKIVHNWFDQILSQEARLTHWDQRPLNPEQILYAQEDVRYLREMHARFQEWSQERKIPFFENAMRQYIQTLWNDCHYSQAWKRFTYHKPQWTNGMQRVMGPLVIWREWMAQHYNKPRKHIVSDETLLVWSALKPTEREQKLSAWRPKYTEQDRRDAFIQNANSKRFEEEEPYKNPSHERNTQQGISTLCNKPHLDELEPSILLNKQEKIQESHKHQKNCLTHKTHTTLHAQAFQIFQQACLTQEGYQKKRHKRATHKNTVSQKRQKERNRIAQTFGLEPTFVPENFFNSTGMKSTPDHMPKEVLS